LLISSSVNAAADLVITGGGLLELTGTLTVNQVLSVPNFTMAAGTLTGSGILTITGAFNWTDGTMGGSGRTIIAAGATGTLATTSIKEVNNSRVLENRGSLVHSGGSVRFGLNGSSSGRIENKEGASYEIQGTAGFIQNFSGPYSFDNAGLISKTGEGISSFGSSVALNNTGTMLVVTGGLQLSGGGSHGGFIDIAAGASLNLSAGIFTFSADAELSGAGTFSSGGTVTFSNILDPTQSIQITAGTVAFGQNQSIASLVLSGGTLGGSNTLTITESFTWTGGAMGGSGRTILATTATGSFSGVSLKELNNTRVLENRGGITQSGGSVRFGLSSGSAGRIENAVGATYEIQGTSGFAQNVAGAHVLENQGTLRKTGAGNASFSPSVQLVNGGLLSLEEAVLTVANSFLQSASGEVRLAGGNLSATTLSLANGRVTGVGNITGNVTNSGAVISPGATGNRTISIIGAYTQQPGGTLELDLDGDAASGSFDKLAITGAASLDGTLSLRNSLDLANELFTLLTHGSRSGTFPTISVTNGGSAVPTYLTTRSDFTVTADAPPAEAPQLAASYQEWVDSVQQTWGEAAPATTPTPEDDLAIAADAGATWNADPFADPDLDGSNNLLEYAFQSNPLDPLSTPRMTIQRDPARPGRLTLSCLRRADASDIVMVLESSSDFKTWRAAGWIEELDGQLETKRMAPGIERCLVEIDPSGTDTRFWRWSVRMNP
jgi:hypothetical protein